jgi:hypothetical protein
VQYSIINFQVLILDFRLAISDFLAIMQSSDLEGSYRFKKI